MKREDIHQKNKKAKNQRKLEKRLARAKEEANDPVAKKVKRSKCVITLNWNTYTCQIETPGGERPPNA